MNQSSFYEKGNINVNYKKKNIMEKIDNNSIKEILKRINLVSDGQGDSFLEISHDYSSAYQTMLEYYKEGIFLCDQPFEAMLVYHFSNIMNWNLTVYNNSFTINSFNLLKHNEKFDLIYSIFGISFSDIYSLMPGLLNLLKIDAVTALLIPSYWYDNAGNTEIENQIMSYSRQNDKKWIFVDKIDDEVEKNGGRVLELAKMPFTVKINRFELAYLSSLEKLYDSVLKKNTAHLEICGIPEDNLELRASLLVIKKIKKTLTKDSLFKS